MDVFEFRDKLVNDYRDFKVDPIVKTENVPI